MATETMRTGVHRQARVGSGLMALAGLGFIGYGVIFFILNFSDQFLELGISTDEVPVTRDQIKEFSPELFEYISHLHIAIAGFLIALGVAVAALSWVGVGSGQRWAWWTAVASAVLAVGIALPAHYPNDFDTIEHLGLIYLAVAIFVVGAVLTLRVAVPRPGAH
ncbi:hypothetical protein E1262_04750 [Jiangella aurantiaca]|uniref:Uncharacterized protein n=1 Tax=Jiangella aurantiaca TaxID=2530373 RepID=A0A4R5AJR0_9ACTN|nr:hypothetical protein [Jiangella aurantiaca]TDD72025.1 hypothetical protein E1262_04750 [Jiangella aurantiaca]